MFPSRRRHPACLHKLVPSGLFENFSTSTVSRKSIPSLQGAQGSGTHLGPCAWHVLAEKIPKMGCSSSSSPPRAMGSNSPSILPTPGVPLPTPICLIARNSWKRPKITHSVPWGRRRRTCKRREGLSPSTSLKSIPCGCSQSTAASSC